MVPDSSPSDAVDLDADVYADHVLVRLRDGRDVWLEIPDYNRIFRVCASEHRDVREWLEAELPRHGAMPLRVSEILDTWARYVATEAAQQARAPGFHDEGGHTATSPGFH